MGISKAQAQALADNFLLSVGSDDDLVVPRNLATAGVLIAAQIAEKAQQNLNAHTGSGELSKSITVTQPESIGGAKMRVRVMMKYYGEFLDKGVRGTVSGTGKYAFKTPYPNRKMAQALMAGIDAAKLSTANVNPNHPVGRHERKNLKLAQIDKAYGAATNIKKYGIKPTGFMSKAIDDVSRDVKERLKSALKADIDAGLKKIGK